MSERVELDRLADYAAGLLDGTPEAAAVAHLIATDPGWATAYTELDRADRRVRAELVALRDADEPMPAEVVTRLRVALDAAAVGEAGSSGGRTVVSLDAARRRRRRRWAGVAAVAAGVAAFGVFALPQLSNQMDGETNLSTGGADPAHAPERDDASSPTSGPLVQASGTDYRRETLRPLAAEPAAAAGDPLAPADRIQADGGVTKSLDGVPDALRPLIDPAARGACLAAVVASYGGRPAIVDYARFEGVPALVIQLVGTGSRGDRVVVVGAGCGTSGAGADLRYTSTGG